jgi:hypothetical protein
MNYRRSDRGQWWPNQRLGAVGAGANRLLVCCRIEEYELYGEKLALHGAIGLEPLTDGQLQQLFELPGDGGAVGDIAAG